MFSPILDCSDTEYIVRLRSLYYPSIPANVPDFRNHKIQKADAYTILVCMHTYYIHVHDITDTCFGSIHEVNMHARHARCVMHIAERCRSLVAIVSKSCRAHSWTIWCLDVLMWGIIQVIKRRGCLCGANQFGDTE